MNTNIDTNNEFRYEILSIGMGEQPYYLSPATGYREYFREVWGWYQPTPEAPLISLSDDGKLRDLIVVFSSYKFELMEGTVASEHGDLTVIDPHAKTNSFAGKLLFVGKLQNNTVLVKIVDATGETSKAISLCFDRYSFSEVQEFLALVIQQFKTMTSVDMENVMQEYRHLFLPAESGSSNQAV